MKEAYLAKSPAQNVQRRQGSSDQPAGRTQTEDRAEAEPATPAHQTEPAPEEASKDTEKQETAHQARGTRTRTQRPEEGRTNETGPTDKHLYFV